MSREFQIISLLEKSGFSTEQMEHTPSYERAHLIQKAIEQKKLSEEELISFCFENKINYLPKKQVEKISIEKDHPQIPSQFAWDHQVILWEEKESSFVILASLANLVNEHLSEDLRQILEREVELIFVLPQSVREKIENFYTEAQSSSSPQAEIGENEAPIIRLVDKMIEKALEMRASDIHIEPQEKNIWIRYRIDGYLNKISEHPSELLAPIVSRIKIMSKTMSMAEKRLPQDGKIQLKIEGQEIDLRVSSIPSIRGESIVIRLFRKEAQSLSIENAGFSGDDLETMKSLISSPDGIILITGPTGSGKTTTLYSFLNHVNHPDKKIITVEDPVEYELLGINQVMIKTQIGMTFPVALRAILRQAPNIIMVGEIRGINTSTIAMNAALTGHLVLSTLHTNDSASAIPRLINMGIQSFLIASSVRAIIAQRLVRKLCSQCKQPAELALNTIKLLNLKGRMDKISQADGCRECNFTGYRGRVGIFEIFIMNDSLRHMINQGESARKLKEKAKEFGMLTLQEDGIKKIVQGLTSVEEILSIT